MVPARPETEFQETRQMKRHFVLHVGPTNCGKTYQALERLRQAESGVYLGPLRLLALEVYEKIKDAGIPCTMLTERNGSTRTTAASPPPPWRCWTSTRAMRWP